MKRLGIRKAVTALFNSSAGQGADKLINGVVTLPGTVSNKLGVKSVSDKLKIDVSGKSARKKANQSVSQKVSMANQKLVMQDALDLAAAKEFEKEKKENILKFGFGDDSEVGIDINSIAATRVKA
jgi:hypothetical protein